MHKFLVLPIVFMSILLDFGAFGAPARNSRGAAGVANANSGNAPVSARAATRATAASAKNAAPVSARSATRTAPKATNSVITKQAAVGNVSARAAKKQNILNKGTKVTTATAMADSVVSQECRDAYFGCMDSFCMLENVTGGRCKCSDKSKEYDDLLTQIMEADQQSYLIQTEGVSLIQMGKSAEEVYSMAEDAAKKVTKDNKQEEENGIKPLLSYNASIWAEEEEDPFAEMDEFLDSDLVMQTGDKLLITATDACSAKIPTQCKDSMSMLRLLYTGMIQSDCAAYDNSLQQQQLESYQKLQTARQSLLDATLAEYQKANKYDLGQCALEFDKCMQGENVCGEDYSECVTLSADDNVRGIKIQKYDVRGKYSTISFAMSTMEQLVSKRVYCDSILDQCVNANKNDAVWEQFLKIAAPAIKTAELDLEDNLRRSCYADLSECYQTGCKNQMDPNNPDGSYDACLTNPDLYKSLCKTKLEPCLLATGGTYDHPEGSSIWQGILATLASLKVGACTTEVRECLLSEDRCGKDYSGCLGLSTYDIGLLCPSEMLTACRADKENMTKDKMDEEIRDYVAQVAQGIALNIDNEMMSVCESALNKAMLKYCGAEDSCPNATVDETMFSGILSVQLCKTDGVDENNQTIYGECSTDPYSFDDQDLIDGKIIATITNQVDLNSIIYNLDNAGREARAKFDKNGKYEQPEYQSLKEEGLIPFIYASSSFSLNNDGSVASVKEKLSEWTKPDSTYNKNALERAVTALNNNFKTIVNSIESDPRVVYCTSGRKVQGFSTKDEEKFIGLNSNKNTARWPMLTQNARARIARAMQNKLSDLYDEAKQQVMDEQFSKMVSTLSNRINEIVRVTQEKQHAINLKACMAQRVNGPTEAPNKHGCAHDTRRRVDPSYDPTTAVCTLHLIKFNRTGCDCGAGCPWEKKEQTEYIQLPTINQIDMRSTPNTVFKIGNSGIKGAIQDNVDNKFNSLDW